MKYKRHGLTKTKIYRIWTDIKARCLNKDSQAYKYYGEKGVSIQEDWEDNFLLFYKYVTTLKSYKREDIGRGGLSLDRLNSNGNYEIDNLRWTTATIQTRNRCIYKNNKTGFIGVFKGKNDKKYRASISFKGKIIHLGSREKAIDSYKLRIDFIEQNKIIGYETEIKNYYKKQKL